MSDSSRSLRLDVALVHRGLVSTRSKAQQLIRQGDITLNGEVAAKPSMGIIDTDRLMVLHNDGYVSRGAYKLVGAFETFAPLGLTSPGGLDCLDIGASTGGFTQALLRRGANRIIALDVGHGQLHASIADNPHVIEMSGVNIREVDSSMLAYRPQLIVSDVSFISLTYVIPVIAAVAASQAQVVLLVKPQFEVGKGRLGKNGIVENQELREQALQHVVDCAGEYGMRVHGTALSPIEGTFGNVEYLLFASCPA